MMLDIVRHLLESALFAVIVLQLVRLLQRQAASLRHMLLLAAVAKFVIPLQGLQTLGESLRSWLPQQVGTPEIRLLNPSVYPALNSTLPQQQSILWHVLLVLWLGGTFILLGRWALALSRVGHTSLSRSHKDEQVLYRAAKRLATTSKVELRISDEALEPYLVGFFRPVLVLPKALPETLSMAEYEAILLHELAHAVRRDNLIRSFVHVVVCLFWFFPLLRWLEHRIEGEAELACDELVLNAGVVGTDYVQGICKVCQQFFLRPLAGRSHVNSFNLGSRMELIMSFSSRKKAVSFPNALGVLPLVAVLLAATATGFAASPAETRANADVTTTNSCVVAGHRFPQGAVVRLNNEKALQLCTFSEGRPKWVATTEAARDHSKTVINLSIPISPETVSCKETAPQGKLCTCDNLSYSPGAVVGSPKGNLVCPASGGRWQPYQGKQTPWPPEPTIAVR